VLTVQAHHLAQWVSFMWDRKQLATALGHVFASRARSQAALAMEAWVSVCHSRNLARVAVKRWQLLRLENAWRAWHVGLLVSRSESSRLQLLQHITVAKQRRLGKIVLHVAQIRLCRTAFGKWGYFMGRNAHYRYVLVARETRRKILREATTLTEWKRHVRDRREQKALIDRNETELELKSKIDVLTRLTALRTRSELEKSNDLDDLSLQFEETRAELQVKLDVSEARLRASDAELASLRADSSLSARISARLELSGRSPRSEISSPGTSSPVGKRGTSALDGLPDTPDTLSRRPELDVLHAEAVRQVRLNMHRLH
jgi:hypothetical protein